MLHAPFALALLPSPPPPRPPAFPTRHLIVASNPDAGGGALSRVETAAPWPVTSAGAIGRDSVVHVFGGLVYVLGRADKTVQVRTLPGLALLQQFSIGEVGAPRDLAMVGSTTALISDHDGKNLWWLDTTTGTVKPGEDLGALSLDGNPDATRMLVDGSRVYVQLQNYDRATNAEHGARIAVLAPGINPEPPVILESVIDLQGIRPDHPMRITKGGRLQVSAPGVVGDWSSAMPKGIEEVDLAAGISLGFLLTEEDCGADLGPFAMVEDEYGFAIGHTSIGASTHLYAFERRRQLAELHSTVTGIHDVIAFDATTRTVFYPVGAVLGSPGGVLAFHADTWAQLSASTIETAGAPFSMVVAP